MARMSIDDSALRDGRIRRVARTLRERFGDDVRAWPDFEMRYALGTMLFTWAVCYDRETPTLPPRDIDTAALIEGFFAELVKEDLATDTAHGIYVRGARKRIAYLNSKEEAGRVGGKESGKMRRRKVRDVTRGEAQSKQTSNLPDRVPDPVPDEVPVSVPDTDKVPDPAPPRATRRAPFESTPQGSDLIDAISAAYARKNGTRPTWSTPTGKRLATEIGQLVREHGADEVKRRALIAWGERPPWPHTWDVSAFVRHFDKAIDAVAQPKRDARHGRIEPKRNATAEDYASPFRADREARERERIARETQPDFDRAPWEDDS